MTYRSLFSAVSGLRNHQTRLDVIGNNISNVNTVGFKTGRVTFQDIFSQTIRAASPSLGNQGGINPLQVGLGAQVGTIDNIFTQGNFQTTGRTFDLAIEGEGFFTLANMLDASGDRFYTRAGNFNIDSRGYLVNPSNGYSVMGLLANTQGEINRNEPPQAIQVDFGSVSPAIVTRNVTLGGNLNTNVEPQPAGELTSIRSVFNADGDVGNLRIGDVVRIEQGTIDPGGIATDVTGVNVLTVEAGTTLDDLAAAIQAALRDPDGDGNPADGDPNLTVAINNDGTFSLTTSLDLQDLRFEVVDGAGAQLGDQTAFMQSILNDGDDTDGDAADIDIAANNQIATAGYFRQADVTTSIDVFDSQGNARTVTMAFARDLTQANVFNWQAIVPHVDGNDPTGSFPTGDHGSLLYTSSGLLEQTIPATLPPLIFDPDGTGPQNNGVDPLQITLDFSSVTQFAADSTAAIESQDGSPQGTLDDISIDGRGIIRGLFTNGVTLDLAQVLLASIPNEEGLIKVGDSMFQSSPNTGQPVLGEATERGRGAISSGTLELSNVDLATEFTDLIITQRGFQANSRVISTGDEVLNELVNII